MAKGGKEAALDAVDKAEAAAAAGMSSAQAGYRLTKEALTENGAPSVFPLILLSGTAIAGSLTAYAATEAAAKAAEAQAERDYGRAKRRA